MSAEVKRQPLRPEALSQRKKMNPPTSLALESFGYRTEEFVAVGVPDTGVTGIIGRDTDKELRYRFDFPHSKTQEKLEVYFRENERKLYSLAYRFCGNAHDAQDLVQKVEEKSWIKHYLYTDKGTIGAWLAGIMQNQNFDDIRRREVRVAEVALGNVPESTRFYSSENLEEHAERLDQAEKLRSVVAKLPEKYREIIELRHFSDLSYDEISDRTGLPKSTIRMRLYRARESMGQLDEVKKLAERVA